MVFVCLFQNSCAVMNTLSRSVMYLLWLMVQADLKSDSITHTYCSVSSPGLSSAAHSCSFTQCVRVWQWLQQSWWEDLQYTRPLDMQNVSLQQKQQLALTRRWTLTPASAATGLLLLTSNVQTQMWTKKVENSKQSECEWEWESG